MTTRRILAFAVLVGFSINPLSSHDVLAQARDYSPNYNYALDMQDGVDKLMELDQNFSKLSVEKGAPFAFSIYLSPSAVTAPQGGGFLHGLPAIVADLESLGEITLSWQPLGGALPEGSDMGFTYGRYIIETVNLQGEPVVGYGKYVSIWQKQPDGSWKIVYDMGNNNPPPMDTKIP